MSKPTADEVRQVIGYDHETGKFYRVKPWGSRGVGSEPGSISTTGYLQIGVYGRTYTAHRLAWLLHYGEWPTDLVDHINRNKLDNRIANLRCVNRSGNAHNAGVRKNNRSGVTGVRKMTGCNYTKPWEAYITISYKHKTLGYFSTVEEAAAARLDAEKRLGTRPTVV